LELGEARPLDVELARLRSNLAHMTKLSPQLARQLGNWLDLVEERAASTPILDLCQCHGDFSYTQLIFDGPQAGLVDFDNFCRAEPALDLGQFLAYLHYAGLKARAASPGAERDGVTEDLARRFADSYLASGGRLEALRRVPIYEATNLIRMAEHAWQNLKSRRLEQLVTLLGERMAA
jgi:aminoglycoside phosphotransferase (APT) family kinase protein